MACCKNDALLLARRDAGRCTTMRLARTLPHFHENQRAVRLAHDQIDFPAATPGRPIIPLHQLQARRLQVCRSPILGSVAD